MDLKRIEALIKELIADAMSDGSLVDRTALSDLVALEAQYRRPLRERVGVIGSGFLELINGDGNLKRLSVFSNLVTENGDKFYGDRAAIILASTVAITGNTNADPSVVTTGSAHNLGVGDKVIVAGHTPAALNGNWVITATGSTTTFTIDVGAAPGAFSSGGTAQGLTVPPVSGMKLGTGGETAASKTGAGATIVTYITASHKAIDSTWPQSSLNGSSRRIQYKTTWNAGEATATGIDEWTIAAQHPLANDAGTAAQTIARAVDTANPVNKTASDTLAITWNHDLLGA